MIFYKILFNSIPELEYACSVRTDKYKNIVNKRPKMIELNVCNASRTTEESKSTYTIPPYSFNLVMPDMSFKAYASNADNCYISSIAVKGDFTFERIESDDRNYIKGLFYTFKDCIFLPLYFELGNKYTSIERNMKQLISYYMNDTFKSKIRSSASWLEIAASIDELFRSSIINTKFDMPELYSIKAKKYIEQHYSEHLEVKSIAKMLNISPNYLSNIFKKYNGITLTEFINITRLKMVRDIIYDGKLSFNEAAKSVGICSGTYLNKLFLKYYGVSVRNFKMIDHEISLYHDKPWDVENLESDIYKSKED